jgi:hypothetical protein
MKSHVARKGDIVENIKTAKKSLGWSGRRCR